MFRRFVQPGGDSGCERHNVSRPSQRQHPGSGASRWWLDDNHLGAYFYLFVYFTPLSHGRRSQHFPTAVTGLGCLHLQQDSKRAGAEAPS